MTRHTYFLPDGSTYASYTSCPSDDEPEGPTIADITAAFKQIPMSPPPLHVQPPSGETLVNFDTIFYADPTTLDKTVTVLGTRVDFHITVASYTWRYGDGTTQTTADPGAAYPHQSIVHRYRHPEKVAVSVDTTYQADYRIGDGPRQHLAATVTIEGPKHSLRIRTATPHLVGS